jgi:uncharacterized DUF497 family protein
MIRYEWDEAKRLANLDKHGLDFGDADLVHESIHKITVDVSRADDGETRHADFAPVGGLLLKLVYSVRKESVRCISFRLASSAERKTFHEVQDR